MKVACIQTSLQPNAIEAIEQNSQLANYAIENGSDFLVFPEHCGGLYRDGEFLKPTVATESAHPVLSNFKEIAASNKKWILVGSLGIKASSGKHWNRSFLIDSQGIVRGRYNKIHLFDADLGQDGYFRESARVESGNQVSIVATNMGLIGQTICYDLRFPYLYRMLAISGAQIFTVPSAFTRVTGEAHWHILNRARAIENGAFIIAPCASGPIPGGGDCFGHSLIISPWGEILVDGGTGVGIFTAIIDLGLVAEARKKIPSLLHSKAFGLNT